jgi:hypothetical protein
LAVLGVAGILGQEILKPDVFWYNAGLPENIPDLYFGPNKVMPVYSIDFYVNCLNQGGQW